MRCCGQGIFRPGMFGILGAEVFANQEIGGLPETVKVLGDLNGAEVGAEKMEDERDPAGGDARRVGPAEKFLETSGEHRRLSH